VSIDDVAQELYALVPEEFTATRNARAKEAKAAGDAELAAQVQALRKPTAGAWLLNQLVRRHADEVQQVLDLGAQLRAAQGSLGAAEVRVLDQQRRQLTRAVAQQARRLGLDAGRRVTDQVTTDVEETLRSAMVDEAAGAALLTGLLTDTFSSTGLEPVDLSRVVAVTGSATGATTAQQAATAPEVVEEPDPALERRVAEAEGAVAGARADLGAAGEAAEQARAVAATARAERESLEQQRDEARRVLREVEKRLGSAAEREDAATLALEQADERRESATEAAERSQRRLDRVREHH
jgi:chromosome segregation ATPase